MPRWLVLILVASITGFGVTACGSDPVDVGQDPLPEALFGTWSWFRATGGIAGDVRTPASEGYTLSVEFTSPDRVELSRNGEVEVTTTFEFVPEQMVGSAVRSAQLLYAELFMGFDEQWVDVTEAGDLVLSDPCCDGFTYEWSREP